MDYVFSASEKGNFSFAQILLRRYIILITRTYRNLQRRSHNDTNVCDVTVCFRSYRFFDSVTFSTNCEVTVEETKSQRNMYNSRSKGDR